MDIEQLSEVFEKQAFVYDETILRLVPNYAEQHEVMAKLIQFEHTRRLSVLTCTKRYTWHLIPAGFLSTGDCLRGNP